MRDENRKSLAGRVLDATVYPLLRPAAARRLRQAAQSCRSLDELIDLATDFRCGMGRVAVRITPSQVKSEIRALLDLLTERKPSVLMEIGTNMGGTLFLFARVAAADACLVSLDLPGGAFGGGYPDWKAPLFRSFARDRQQVHLLRMNSHDPATRERVQALLAGRRLDFLLIDGDHSYEGVKADFEQYRDFVRKGGLIACHDIVPGHEARVGGVARFWQEHRSLYPYREFVGSPVQKGFGIGVWFV